MEVIRIGRVSSIDYKKGMVSVYYEDKTASVTALLPMLSNGEYKMPGIGELVLVAHLSNGTTQGIVIGTIWNDEQVPKVNGAGEYIKSLSGETYIKASTSDITFQIPSGSISVSQMLTALNRLSALEKKHLN